MKSREFRILGVAADSACPLCIEPTDGRTSKDKRPPIFVVASEGAFNGICCAPHLAALIRAEEGAKVSHEEPKKTAQPLPPKPPAAVLANGGAQP